MDNSFYSKSRLYFKVLFISDAITVFAVNCCMTGVAVIAELALLFVLLHKKLKAEKAFQAKKTT